MNLSLIPWFPTFGEGLNFWGFSWFFWSFCARLCTGWEYETCFWCSTKYYLSSAVIRFIYKGWNISLHRECRRKWFRAGLELLEGNNINANAWERWSNAGKMEGPYHDVCLLCSSFSSLTGLSPKELKYILKKLKDMWELFLKLYCTSTAGLKGCISLKKCNWKQHWFISQVIFWRW